MKKSLFSKPAWAAKSTPAVDHDQAVFGQDVYEDFLEAKRKAEERRIAKQKEKEEYREKESKRQSVTTQVNDGQVVKKRRISNEPIQIDNDSEDDENDLDSEDDGSASRNSAASSDVDQENNVTDDEKQSNENSSAQRKPRNNPQVGENHKSQSPVKSSKPTTITIDDDDEEDVPIQTRPARSKPVQSSPRNAKPKPPPIVGSDPESEEDDEYIRELKRKARAEAREKRAHLSLSGVSHQRSLRDDSERTEATRSNGFIKDPENGTPQPTADPRDPSDLRVQILITTLIPDCCSLVIERFASQPLDKVFTYWKKRNEIKKPELMDQVFFTWNGQKLYNSTTTRSILEQIKRKHGTKIDGSDLAEGKVEIEAMIQEIYDYRLDQKKRFQAEAEGNAIKIGEPLNENGDAIESPKQQNPGIVITLKSKDKDVLPFLNLRVRPDTTVQRIVNGYKKKVKLGASRQIYLVFDGERLDPEADVEQIGLEDEDAVDVME